MNVENQKGKRLRSFLPYESIKTADIKIEKNRDK